MNPNEVIGVQEPATVAMAVVELTLVARGETMSREGRSAGVDALDWDRRLVGGTQGGRSLTCGRLTCGLR